ncbi:MAG: hypothetical protein EAZ95_17835, partial [Bacteroidetes bacterium]
EQTLTGHPTNVQTRNELGICYKLKGKYDKAIEIFEQTLTGHPTNVQTRNELGICYKLKGKYDNAIEIFEQTLTEQPTNVQTRNELGICYKLKREYDKAIKIFEQILTEQPTHVQSKNELGICYKLKREYNKAIEIFEQILTEQPTNVQARNEVGICYRLKGEIQTSINFFHKAIELHPDNTYFQFQLSISQNTLHQKVYADKKRLGIVLNVFENYIVVFAVEEQFFRSFEVPNPQDYPLYQAVLFSLEEIIKIIPKEDIRPKFFIESTVAWLFPDRQEGFIYNINNQSKQGKDYFFDYDACDFEPQVGDKVHFISVLNPAKKYQGKPVAVLIKKAVHICQIRNCYNKMTHSHIEAFDVHTNTMLKFDQELPQKLKRGQQFYYEKQGSKIVLLEERK